MTGSPSWRESEVFSPSFRQQATRTRRLLPSTQMERSRSKRRAVEATLKVTSMVPVVVVRRHSGVVSTFPMMVTGVSNMTATVDFGHVRRQRRYRDLWTARVLVDKLSRPARGTVRSARGDGHPR